MSADSESKGAISDADSESKEAVSEKEWSSGGAPSGRVLSGKFRIRELLGAGGMGAVYVAEHALTRRVGALKLLHASFAKLPETRERFLREASAAGLIGNPHIVETYDAGTLQSGEPYIFMELLSGSGLDHALGRESPLGLEAALDITIQAARALHAAHQAGIVHRDVKPANLFLLDGARPFVKVLDFGISKFAPVDEEVPHELTREGALLGTPVYMSPEQVMGHRDLDARTDVYSLAVVLYELLTGKAPFQGSSLMQLSANICRGDYVPPSRSRKDLPEGLERVLDKALHRDRDERFLSAEAFADALKEFCPELAEPSTLAPNDRASARSSGRPSERASERPSAARRGVAAPRRSHNPSLVDAPTLEPHSTTDPAPRAAPVEPRRSTSKRALWVSVPLLAAFAGWLVIRGGLGPPAPEVPLSASSGFASEPIVPTAIPSASLAAAETAERAQVAPPPTASAATRETVRPPRPRTPEAVESPRSAEGSATSAPAERDGLTVENPFQ